MYATVTPHLQIESYQPLLFVFLTFHRQRFQFYSVAQKPKKQR